MTSLEGWSSTIELRPQQPPRYGAAVTRSVPSPAPRSLLRTQAASGSTGHRRPRDTDGTRLAREPWRTGSPHPHPSRLSRRYPFFAHQFHHPEIIAEDPALTEKKGNYHCQKFPRKPGIPRKWDLWGGRGKRGSP